jgi:transcriptional regulator with XRE-family HTH domain
MAPHTDPDTPADRLRAARKVAGLSQREVADRLGIKQPVYHRAESGARPVTLDWLLRAADAIGCDPNDLDPRLARRAENFT